MVTQAAGRPLVGQSAIDAASLVSEEEDLTIFGNVGTAIIDVNGGESAYDIVQSINAAQTETGVYANAQTRVNLSSSPTNLKQCLMLFHSNSRV